MTTAALPEPDTCPRCGSSFTCGAAGPGPCPCASVSLSPALQARLRQQFSGCLCLGCLRELSTPEAPEPQT